MIDNKKNRYTNLLYKQPEKWSLQVLTDAKVNYIKYFELHQQKGVIRPIRINGGNK